jgi:hypothetical protein
MTRNQIAYKFCQFIDAEPNEYEAGTAAEAFQICAVYAAKMGMRHKLEFLAVASRIWDEFTTNTLDAQIKIEREKQVTQALPVDPKGQVLN